MRKPERDNSEHIRLLPKKSLSKTPDRAMKIKLMYIVSVLLFAFVLMIGYNLYMTAVFNSDEFRERANTQQLDGFVLNANRGMIFDRDGRILAKSETVWNVILSPYDVRASEDDPAEIAEMLHEVLGIDRARVLGFMERPNSRYEIVARRIDRDLHDLIIREKARLQLGLYSIYLIEDTVRVYPNDTLASNLIGFTNYDNMGLYGVEAFYDEYLQGVDGRLMVLRDGAGRVMPGEFERRYEASDGNNVYMTIDVVLQHYLEKHLEAAVLQHNVANRATGIMMNPNTGAILAMATTFGYDLNNPTVLTDSQEAYLQTLRERLIEETVMGSDSNLLSDEQLEGIDSRVQSERANLWEVNWRNKAVTELYFPGSVFKTVTAAMALEERVVTDNSTFHCNAFVEIAGTKIRCWVYNRGRNHGSMNLTEAMRHSCNPAFIDIGSRVGVQRFYDYMEAFGLTTRTGVDLFAEANPIVTNRSTMSQIDLAMCSIGQTNKITPLQMITAYAATINGGYLVTPHVVERITDNDGNVIRGNNAGVRRQILSRETSDYMRVMMEEVVRANGGSNAYISGFRIGGKSGTSEKIDEYDPDDMRYVASFAAFAPADNPQVIMLVVVDEPMGDNFYGSQVAAPVVSAVFRESFAHLEIFPQFTEEEMQQQDTLVPNLLNLSTLDANVELNRRGLNSHEIGEGRRVVRTVPEAGTPIGRGSTVVVYFCEESAADLAESTVPDVHGMSVSSANTAITNAGLNIRFAGGAVGNNNARAASMSIEPGTSLPRGTVIEVRFAVDDGHGG
jgi:stage V sporulation protein D (sporulation-specific penicillin-binding protein)